MLMRKGETWFNGKELPGGDSSFIISCKFLIIDYNNSKIVIFYNNNMEYY